MIKLVDADGIKARWDTAKGILIDPPFGPWPRPEDTKVVIGVDPAAGPDQAAILLATRKYEIRLWARLLPQFVHRWLFRYELEWLVRRTTSLTIHAHLPTCDTQFERPCPAGLVAFDEKPTQHWWSGWPGAMCMKCGDEDKVEVCIGRSCRCPCHGVAPYGTIREYGPS